MSAEFPADVLVQSGAVGISIGLMLLLYLREKAHDKMVANHMHTTDELIIENTKAMAKMSGSLDNNANATDRSTEVSKRIERVLDRR